MRGRCCPMRSGISAMALLSLYRILLPALPVALLLQNVQGQQAYAPRSTYSQTSRRSSDPRDLYWAAHELMREAGMLAEKQSYYAALQKGQEAERILASIVRDFPAWKSIHIVDAKRRLLAENMASYRRKVGKSTIPTARQQGSPVSVEVTHADIPGMPGSEARSSSSLPNYATTDPKLYHEIARLQEEVRRVAEAYRDLNTRFVETQKKLVAEQMEKNMYKDRYDKLTEQISAERAAGNSVVESLSRRLADAESKYHAAEAALQESQARAAELEARLGELQDALARTTRERDDLLIENEKLRAIVELNSPEKTKALLDQNLTLAEQLKTAREKISELEAMQSGTSDENAVLARQLDETRAEAARLRDEMSSIYDENMGFRRRISELTQQLNNLEADLAARAEQPQQDPAMAEENKLLRGIIEKQRRTIAMQEESRRLLFETYRALKKDDPEVMAILKKMQDDDPQALTEDELKVLEDVRNGITQQKKPEADETARLKMQLETLVGLANSAFSKGRYISAEQLYMTLYDLQPDNVAGLVNLGTILLYNNKNEDATRYLTRAARLAPNLAIGYYLAGIALYRQEQMGEAQKMFARAVQLDPGNAEAFFYLANIEAIAGSYDRALKHYAASVKIRPELADAHYNMARLYAETSRIPEAARSYDRAVHNGSLPDPEFDAYLRRHPDNTRRPGTDLVAAVKPEDEARQLKDIAPEPPKPEDATHTATSPEAAAEQSFREAVAKITADIPATAEPSPAGAGHELDPALLTTIQMRTRSGMKTMRVKRPQPQKLRTRGAE